MIMSFKLIDKSWDYESNVRYAQTAENVGFEYALTQIRFMAGYGAVGAPTRCDLKALTNMINRKTSMNPSLSRKLCYMLPRN